MLLVDSCLLSYLDVVGRSASDIVDVRKTPRELDKLGIDSVS
jgi:hypothetical protein